MNEPLPCDCRISRLIHAQIRIKKSVYMQGVEMMPHKLFHNSSFALTGENLIARILATIRESTRAITMSTFEYSISLNQKTITSVRMTTRTVSMMYVTLTLPSEKYARLVLYTSRRARMVRELTITCFRAS